MLDTATRNHAAYLTRIQTAPLSGAPRIALFDLNPPTLIETNIPTRPLGLRIPLPSHRLLVAVSSITGLIEIEDDGSSERAERARLATAAVNEQKTRLVDEVGRLMTAVSRLSQLRMVLNKNRSSPRTCKNRCDNSAGCPLVESRFALKVCYASLCHVCVVQGNDHLF